MHDRAREFACSMRLEVMSSCPGAYHSRAFFDSTSSTDWDKSITSMEVEGNEKSL